MNDILVNKIPAETKDKAAVEGAGLIGGEVEGTGLIGGGEVEGAVLRGTDVSKLMALQHSAWASTVASTHFSEESWLFQFARYSPPHVKSDPKPSSEIAVLSVEAIYSLSAHKEQEVPLTGL